MSLDLNNITTVTRPESADIRPTTDNSVLAGNIAAARSDSPEPIGGGAPLPPLVVAGFSLAKYALAMMSCSIIMLLMYLAFMDYTAGSDISAIYSKLSNPNRTGTEIYTLSEFDRATVDFAKTPSANSATLPDTARSNISGVIARVDKLPSTPAGEGEFIQHSADIPSDDSRHALPPVCIDAVDEVRQTAVEAPTIVSDAQITADFAANIVEERSAVHSFWIQTAQLIFLNLLLAVLTGLCGYVFGAQKAAKQP